MAVPVLEEEGAELAVDMALLGFRSTERESLAIVDVRSRAATLACEIVLRVPFSAPGRCESGTEDVLGDADLLLSSADGSAKGSRTGGLLKC